MLQDNEFIKLTGTGLQVADFTQIRSSLINKYRSIYGSDIDLSTGTADGVFVNELSLIINNILQCMSLMYQNLNVETASGIYLDTLCALSNITRKPATSSNAYVNLTYISQGSASISLSPDELTLIDRAGNLWKPVLNETDTDATITFYPGQTKSVYVICQAEGPISAPAGWIYEFIDASLTFTIDQTEDAKLGTLAESDASLRARRAQSTGAAGTTTVEALIGALLQINVVNNAYVVENNTGSPTTVSDGTTVDAHSVYVTIALNDGTSVLDSEIGSIIYEKLTPGIHSCDTGDTDGESHSYQYKEIVNGLTQEIVAQYIYWKQAIPICPDITLTITPNKYFTTDEFPEISKSLMDYANGRSLNEALTADNLLVASVKSDPTFRGLSTYTVSSVSAASYVNNITYYRYYYYNIACAGTVTHTGGADIVIADGEFTLDSKTFTVYNDRVTYTDGSNVVHTYMLTDNTFEYSDVTYTVNISSYTKDLSGNYVITIKG